MPFFNITEVLKETAKEQPVLTLLVSIVVTKIIVEGAVKIAEINS